MDSEEIRFKRFTVFLPAPKAPPKEREKKKKRKKNKEKKAAAQQPGPGPRAAEGPRSGGTGAAPRAAQKFAAPGRPSAESAGFRLKGLLVSFFGLALYLY